MGGGGGHKKQYIGGNCLKKGPGAVCRYKGSSLAKKRAMYFM